MQRAASLTVKPSSSSPIVAAREARARAPSRTTVDHGVTISGDIHIHLTQQPGEDAGALAKRLAAELAALKRSAAAREASSYEDRD